MFIKSLFYKNDLLIWYLIQKIQKVKKQKI